MYSQLPDELAVAVPIWLPLSYSLMVLLAAAVPLSWRVLSLVMPSPAFPVSFENEAIVGAEGAEGVEGVEGAEGVEGWVGAEAG
jgi:hypothetical protein